MANVIRIKRRTSGAVGGPATLKSGELAYNNMDNTIYAGFGDDGSGNATSVKAVAGEGTFALLNSPAFTGNPTATTQLTTDNSTRLATTAYVKSQGYGTGSVTSVALNLPSIFSVSGSPVTTSGTLTATLASQAANNIFASPDGTAGSPTFRALVANDIPTLTAAKISNFDTQVRTSRLDQMAAPTASVSMNNQTITNLGAPVNANDAATKAYVDAVKVGLDVKDSVRVASTANVTVSYAATAGASSRGQISAAPNTLDGVTLVANNRILLKDQTTGAQNGIWVVTTVGTGANGVWDRASDFDADSEVTSGAFVFVEEGTTNADSGWVLTTDGTITIGGASGTALAFAQFSGAGQITAGAGLTKTGNTLDVGTANTGRIVVNADNIDLATVGTAGTYRSVTTDAYGRVTAGTNPTTFSGYGISDTSANLAAAITDETGSGSLVFATSPSLVTPSLSGETFSTNNAVTAGTSNVQGQGALTADFNVVTTVTATNAVTLPTATQGRRLIVVNKGANALNIYPAAGATIDALSVNSSISLPVNAVMEFNASSTTQWYSSYNLTSATSGVSSFSAGTTGLTPSTGTTGAVTLGGTLNVSSGGTGVTTLSGIAYGNGTSAFTAATGSQIATAIGTATVTNATNASNSAITNDAVTATSVYPTWVTANTGNLPTYVSSTKLSFVPSTGVLSATGFSGSGASLTSLSASNISSGVLSSTYGGTGVNNGSNTITLAGNLATSGAFGITLTATGITNVTLPTSGTLVNTSVSSLSSLSTVGTITTGTWNGSTIGVAYGGTGATTLTGLVKGNGTAAFSAAVAGTDYHDTNSTIDGGTF